MQSPLRPDLWIDRFCAEMSRLGVRAAPEHIVEMAWELHPTQGFNDPEAVARAEWDEWPPHDH